jgi:hypothetical protein
MVASLYKVIVMQEKEDIPNRRRDYHNPDNMAQKSGRMPLGSICCIAVSLGVQ